MVSASGAFFFQKKGFFLFIFSCGVCDSHSVEAIAASHWRVRVSRTLQPVPVRPWLRRRRKSSQPSRRQAMSQSRHVQSERAGHVRRVCEVFPGGKTSACDACWHAEPFACERSMSQRMPRDRFAHVALAYTTSRASACAREEFRGRAEQAGRAERPRKTQKKLSWKMPF